MGLSSKGKTLSKKKPKKNPKTKKVVEPIRKEIRGIIFILIAIILGVALFSYHPGDPLFWELKGTISKAQNLFGTVGAHLSGVIFRTVGFSSFWLVLLFLALAVLSFGEHALLSPFKMTVTSLFLVFSFSGILGLQLRETVAFRGGAVHAGGFVGWHLSTFMEGLLNYFGAYLLLSAIFIVSLMFCTRLSFGWLLSKIALWASGVIRGLREHIVKNRERRRKKKVREKFFERERKRPKRKVNIVQPKRSPPRNRTRNLSLS